jgi:hypothetical protein
VARCHGVQSALRKSTVAPRRGAAVLSLRVTRRLSPDGRRVEWLRDTVNVYAFHVDVPEGATKLDLEFQFLSAGDGNEGRIVTSPEMLNLQSHAATKSHRDAHRPARGILSGRGLPPRLCDATSGATLYRLQRSAEDRQSQASHAGRLSGETCARQSRGSEQLAVAAASTLAGSGQTAARRDYTASTATARLAPDGSTDVLGRSACSILPVAGANYVGPLLAEVQGYVDFAVGVLAVSKQPDAAPIVGGTGLATTHRRARHDRNDFGDQGTGS